MDNYSNASIEEGNSLFSNPPNAGPSRVRPRYHTPPVPREAGGHPYDPDSSSDLYVNDRSSPADAFPTYANASGVDEGFTGDFEGEAGEPEGEEMYDDEEGLSEGSSGMYDPDADPEAFARRLDELAGVLEMGEVEAKAMRWGPSFNKYHTAPDLPLEDFKALVNHHLAATAWRYPSSALFAPLPGRPSADELLPGGIVPFEGIGDAHPIRVLGKGWTERDDLLLGSLERGVEGMDVDRQELVERE
ncbi:hypothetical protein IAT38_006006 [Cryptococcus sp. DSM 104549]